MKDLCTFSQEDTLLYGAFNKTLLARLYLPDHSQQMARRRLNEWINRHPTLSQELGEAGYVLRQRILTPAQVALIVRYLGKP